MTTLPQLVVPARDLRPPAQGITSILIPSPWSDFASAKTSCPYPAWRQP